MAPSVVNVSEEDKDIGYEYIGGKIQKFIEQDSETGDKLFSVKLFSKEGEVVDAKSESLNNFNEYSEGDSVLMYKYKEENGLPSYGIADFYHARGLIYIFFIFVAIAVLVAGKKGITAVLSVVFSLMFFYFLVISPVKSSFSPLLASLIFISLITLITVPLIHGFNRKSLSAILAIFAGYVVSVFVVYLFKNIALLGLTPSEEFRTLKIIYPSVDIGEILVASLFLGVTGALIDTAVSIASAIFEALHDTKKTFKQVYAIGMQVGKDVLASMTNTLIFAYMSSALPFLILVGLADESFSGLMNMDFIALEFVRTFVGAVSLVVIIPIVSVVSAYLLKGKRV